MKPVRLMLLLPLLSLLLPFLTQFAPMQLPDMTVEAASTEERFTCTTETAGPSDQLNACYAVSNCISGNEGNTAAQNDCYYKWKQEQCENKKHEGYVYVASFNHSCVTVISFVTTLINYLLMFSSIIAGFMFLQSGYRILTSQGNPSAITEARSQLTSALVGMILIATSFVIINFLNGAFGTLDSGIDLIGPFTQESQKQSQ